MKRQADGISRLSDEIEQTEENGNKRIKLLKNEVNKEHFQEVHANEKSVMDVIMSENSPEYNHEDQSASISDNESPNRHVFLEKMTSDSIPNALDPESPQVNFMSSHCNGSFDEHVINASASNSGVVSELYFTHSPENSEEKKSYEDKELQPPCINNCDQDLLQNESTDSFQSESLDHQNARGNSEAPILEKYDDGSDFCDVPENHVGESSCENLEKQENKDELNSETITEPNIETNSENLEKHTNHEQDNKLENEFPFELNEQKIIDVDNFTFSHLKVKELLGHTEEVLSVAADEDFILSSSADTTTKVWNVERQNIISTFSGHSNCVTSVILLNPNQSKKIKKKMSLTKVSRIAITGSLDCQIKLWSVLEGKELASVYTFNGITCLGYLESECLVVVGTEGGKLELWNLSLKKAVISEKAHEDQVTDIKVVDNYIYSVSVDGNIKVWCYEEEELFPVYSRKRKEISSDRSGFQPAQWKTVAVSDKNMYLGDSTNSIKELDWRAGRLFLFQNQSNKQGASCNCVVTKDNALFSSCYDSFTKTSGINVWKLPEMSYVCTLTGSFSKINNLAVVQKENKLRIITGGDKLFLCEVDFSKPPSAEGEFFIREYEMLGHEINENPVEIKKPENNSSSSSRQEENHSSSNRWCNIM